MASSSSIPAASSSDAFPVFINSSLATGLSMTVSSSDTVASLKRVIEREHALAYPEMGEIIVKAIKVRRKGCVYHMIDQMPVIKGFEGLKGQYFLEIDAVLAPQQIPRDQNLERNDFENLEGKGSGQNVVNKLQIPSQIGGLMADNLTSLNEKVLVNLSANLLPVQEAFNFPNREEILQNEIAHIESRNLNPNSATDQETNPSKKKKNKHQETNPSEKKRKKQKSTNTSSEIPDLKETDSKIKNDALKDSSFHEKLDMLSENPIPDSAESGKVKCRKGKPDKKHSLDGKSRERKRKNRVTDKDLITEANGVETITPNTNTSTEKGKEVNEETLKNGNPDNDCNENDAKTGNPNPDSNNNVITGTGTGTETKKLKAKKGVTDKNQVSQEATKKTKKKAKKQKVSDREIGLTEGDANSLAPKETVSNEINTKIFVGSSKKKMSLLSSVHKTNSKKSKTDNADVASKNDDVAYKNADKVPDKDVTIASNGTETTTLATNNELEKQEKVNQAGGQTENPIPDSNQDGGKTGNSNPDSEIYAGIGTGTCTETKKVKSGKGVTKQAQTTQKAEGLVITSKKKKTKQEKISEVPAGIETEFNSGNDTPVFERDFGTPQNLGGANSLAPKEANLYEINVGHGSPKKADTDKTVSSKDKTKPKNLKDDTANVASKNADVIYTNDDLVAGDADMAIKNADDVALKNDDVSSRMMTWHQKEAGQIISSVITDLKEQEIESDMSTELQALIDDELATDTPNPEPKPKSKPKSKVPTVSKVENSKSTSLNGNQDEKKKRKKGQVFAPPLLSGNENNEENASKFETLIDAASSQQENGRKETELDTLVELASSQQENGRKETELDTLIEVASSQQENETNEIKLDSNLVEDPNKQDKKKKRRKNEAKSTVNYTQIVAIKSSEIQNPQKKKTSKVKSKDQSVNIEKPEGVNNKIVTTSETRVHNLNTEKINFIDYFSPDEPKEAKKRNPNLHDEMAEDESTEDENKYQNEAKRYKVAVRKIPIKSSDIASESTKDNEGSFMSDNTTNMKKGFGSKESSADGVIMSQESNRTKEAEIAEESLNVDIVIETEDQDLAL